MAEGDKRFTNLRIVEGVARRVADLKAIADAKLKNDDEDPQVWKGLLKARLDAKGVAPFKGNDPLEANKSCLARAILGSAAIPLGFPSRIINNDMFVDGGTRFGLFATILLTRPEVRQRLIDRKIAPSFHIIINGNMSANSYGTKQPPRTGERLVHIGKAALRNVLDQLYRDAAYRNEHYMRAAFCAQGTGYFSRYTYVSNKEIQDSKAKECTSSTTQQTDDPFDPMFMKCLFGLGYQKGKDQDWLPFEDIPAVPQ